MDKKCMKDNRKKEKLSVIVPVYNVENYLRRCLDSILNQTWQADEIICVDDGSTDRSGEILDEYAGMDSRIKVIHKENEGVVRSRKTGILHSTGEYITFVDSDDWIEQEMYQEMMKLIIDYDADIVTSGRIRDYGNYCVVENEDIVPGFYEGERLKKEIWRNMIDTDEFFRSNISLHIVNKICKRDLIKNKFMMIDDCITVGEDAACAYPCILGADKIVISGKSYYHYCLRGNSIMGNKRINEQEKIEKLFQHMEREFEISKDKVNNIMKQFVMYKYNMLLLRLPENVIFYRDNILFPFGKVNRKDKIVIYGAGKFGVELIRILKKLEFENIAGWVDKANKEGVKRIEDLKELEFDKVLIAVLAADVVKEIKEELVRMGIKGEKIYAIDDKLLLK